MKLKRKLLLAVFSLLVTFNSANLAHAFNLEAAQAYNQALDLYINGKTTDAIVQFERATTLDPQFSDAYYNLGSIYRYTGQLSKAEESFQKVLTLKPNDTSVNYDLALVCIQKDDYKRASSFLKLVSKDSEKYNDAQVKLAFIKREVGDVNKYNSQPKSDSKLEENKITAVSDNDASKTNLNTKENTISTTYNEDNDSENKFVNTEIVTEEQNVDVKPAKLKISKKEKTELTIEEKEVKEEIKAQENETKAVNKHKQEKIKLEDNNSVARDQSDTSKFWDKYNLPSNNKSNERTETVKKVNEDNENIAVNYFTVEDTDNTTKLKLSSKNKKDASLFNKSDNDTPTTKNTATRMAVKTFATGFNGPTGIVRDTQGNFYIANYSENKIYKVNARGEKVVFASSDEINGPLGLAMDNTGNIYVANYLSNTIAKVSPDGYVSTVVTGLKKPYFLYFDNTGMLYVSEQDSNTISEIKLSSK